MFGTTSVVAAHDSSMTPTRGPRHCIETGTSGRTFSEGVSLQFKLAPRLWPAEADAN